MKMFVVLFCDGYSYYFDDDTRYFTSEIAAFNYCQKLNFQLAKESRCKIKQLGDYYEVVEVQEGE